MRMSDGERLIVAMLGQLLARSNANSEDRSGEFLHAAATQGHSWALSSRFSHFLSEEHDEKVALEVERIMEMWSDLESQYVGLSDEDKERLAAEAAPLGNGLQFPGFEFHHEQEHWTVAQFFVNGLSQFENFKDRLASLQGGFLETYRRMLPAYEAERRAFRGLTVTEIIAILKEGYGRKD